MIKIIWLTLYFMFAGQGFAKDFFHPNFWQNATVTDVKAVFKDNIDINTPDSDGNTPLMWAVKFSPNVDIIKTLGDLGADTTHQNHADMNALMIASWANRPPDIICTLVGMGADVNAQNIHGDTALMWGARNAKNPHIIKALVTLGADVNHQNRYGVSALLWAVTFNKNPAVIDMLLQSGVDITVSDRYGNTPYEAILKNDSLKNHPIRQNLRF